MQDDVEQSYLSTTLLAGLFSGLGGLITSLAFTYVYRYFSGFEPTEVFNIVFMTVGLLLISILLSVVYYNLPKNKGNLYFSLIVIAFVVIVVVAGLFTNRGHNAVTAKHFKILLTGVVIITSCFNAIGIPYLSNHKTRLF